jgi:hypothetical protein
MTKLLPERHTYSYHKKLNPKIWDVKTHDLDIQIRVKLLKEVLLFYKFLGVNDLKIQDIIITGSNAGYNYTAKSDLDLHIIVDFSNYRDADILKNLCDTKRFLWSYYYSIKIHGVPTEIYVQDASEGVDSNGIYSLLYGKWLKFPSDKNPNYNDADISQKTKNIKKDLDEVISSPTIEHIDFLLKKIHDFRTVGLDNGGEYSTDNVVYKNIRSLGYIDKLVKVKQKLIDKKYSLK